MYKNLVSAGACALVAACFLTPAFAQNSKPSASAPEPLKVGFVYVAPLTGAGWVHQHDEGRKAVEAALGARVKTRYVENVAEGPDGERVIRDLAQQGYQLIFTPSFGYMEATLKVAQEFPKIKFESITGYKTAPNVAVANARYYEGRYLSGIAAARMSKAQVAGYVAGFPIPEVLQGINAFTLGMRSVNPKAQVHVVWLNTWFDPTRERDAAMTLMNQGADVLAFFTPGNFDLLLIDQQLPDVEWPQLVESLRQREAAAGVAATSIVLLARDASEAVHKMAQAVGVNSLLIKPVRQVELLRMLMLHGPLPTPGNETTIPPPSKSRE